MKNLQEVIYSTVDRDLMSCVLTVSTQTGYRKPYRLQQRKDEKNKRKNERTNKQNKKKQNETKRKQEGNNKIQKNSTVGWVKYTTVGNGPSI